MDTKCQYSMFRFNKRQVYGSAFLFVFALLLYQAENDVYSYHSPYASPQDLADKGLMLLSTAEKICPYSSKMYYLKQRCFSLLGDSERAIVSGEQAMELENILEKQGVRGIQALAKQE